jgi:hypothetical protein
MINRCPARGFTFLVSLQQLFGYGWGPTNRIVDTTRLRL